VKVLILGQPTFTLFPQACQKVSMVREGSSSSSSSSSLSSSSSTARVGSAGKEIRRRGRIEIDSILSSGWGEGKPVRPGFSGDLSFFANLSYFHSLIDDVTVYFFPE
jgi:hypothetical protein